MVRHRLPKLTGALVASPHAEVVPGVVAGPRTYSCVQRPPAGSGQEDRVPGKGSPDHQRRQGGRRTPRRDTHQRLAAPLPTP